ncbi:MAG: ankyrin repeat domain-containing protein [Deltaproteobacteria bacterium]|nr:ankyrin repeat domain-containing protein [Deltaproteobacteria bacterium]
MERAPFAKEELSAKDEDGLTLLHLAAQDGATSTVAALLAQAAPIEARDRFDRTPLHWAAISGHKAAARLLVDRGANLEARAYYDMTPLLVAALAGEAELVELLLGRGANLDARNMYGMSALHEASDPAVVKLLLKVGLKPGVVDKRGMTPLHLVYTKGVAQAVLDAGADPFAPAHNGIQPVQMAAAADAEKPAVVVYPQAPFIRLAGPSATFVVAVRNVTPHPVDALRLEAETDFATVTVAPAPPVVLNPAELVDYVLTLARDPAQSGDAGVATLRLTRGGGTVVSHLELPIDARRGVTPEDQGKIKVATVSLRAPPAAIQYLAYLAAPLVIIALWAITRLRRRKTP